MRAIRHTDRIWTSMLKNNMGQGKDVAEEERLQERQLTTASCSNAEEQGYQEKAPQMNTHTKTLKQIQIQRTNWMLPEGRGGGEIDETDKGDQTSSYKYVTNESWDQRRTQGI